MSIFVDPKARVAVTYEGNTIYIRAKMDVRTEALYKNELQRLNIKKTSESSGEGEFGHLGTAEMLLRVHNIVAWEGPDFQDENGRPVPVSRENIARMDPTHPLWDLVGERIAELNKKAVAPDPNSPAENGSIGGGAQL